MLQLYDNIRIRRRELKMTQKELANKVGYVSASSITKVEKGLVDLSQTKIEQFAAALQTTAGDLMGWDDSRDSTLEQIMAIYESATKEQRQLMLNILRTIKNG